MICLLCYEPNDEFISVDGQYGRQLTMSMILYKYFRFCFDVSPTFIYLKLVEIGINLKKKLE